MLEIDLVTKIDLLKILIELTQITKETQQCPTEGVIEAFRVAEKLIALIDSEVCELAKQAKDEYAQYRMEQVKV